MVTTAVHNPSAANPYAGINSAATGNSTLPNASSSADTVDSRTRLADNFNTFLTLLTSQLQNQDPLSPMDSTAFTQQLVQFSQVEQQIRTNEQLSGLADQYKAATAGSALSYLGRDAIIQADTTSLANGAAAWSYKLDSVADDVTLTVRDSHGRDIFSGNGIKTAGDHLFNWDGKDSEGQTAPDGVYQLVVTAKTSGGDSVPNAIHVRETIMGVDFSGTTPTVITRSGSRPLDTVSAVLDGS